MHKKNPNLWVRVGHGINPRMIFAQGGPVKGVKGIGTPRRRFINGVPIINHGVWGGDEEEGEKAKEGARTHRRVDGREVQIRRLQIMKTQFCSDRISKKTVIGDTDYFSFIEASGGKLPPHVLLKNTHLIVALALCKIKTNQKKETRNLRSRAVHVRTELENHGATKYIAGVEDWHVFQQGFRMRDWLEHWK